MQQIDERFQCEPLQAFFLLAAPCFSLGFTVRCIGSQLTSRGTARRFFTTFYLRWARFVIDSILAIELPQAYRSLGAFGPGALRGESRRRLLRRLPPWLCFAQCLCSCREQLCAARFICSSSFSFQGVSHRVINHCGVITCCRPSLLTSFKEVFVPRART